MFFFISLQYLWLVVMHYISIFSWISVKQIYRLLILNMTVELHLKQWFSTDGLYKEENMQLKYSTLAQINM